MINLLKLLNLDKLAANLIGYLETKVELYKLDALEALSKLMGKLFSFTLLLMTGGLLLLFGELALAVYIRSVSGSLLLGFTLVFFLNLLIFIVVVMMSRAGFFSRMVAYMIAKMFLQNLEDKSEKVNK